MVYAPKIYNLNQPPSLIQCPAGTQCKIHCKPPPTPLTVTDTSPLHNNTSLLLTLLPISPSLFSYIAVSCQLSPLLSSRSPSHSAPPLSLTDSHRSLHSSSAPSTPLELSPAGERFHSPPLDPSRLFAPQVDSLNLSSPASRSSPAG